jgi:predicted DsbA family dithiol-disulfide isomerase
VASIPIESNDATRRHGPDHLSKNKIWKLGDFWHHERATSRGWRRGRIPFAFEKIQRTPNTFAAHRLVWYAAEHGQQDEVVEALFRSYFVEGKNIGDLKTLAHGAAEAGLDRTEIEEFLAGEKGVIEVKDEEAVGRQLGIRGVPYFVLNGRVAISGAQPPDIIMSAIQQAEKEN